jgi:hypothetical protein
MDGAWRSRCLGCDAAMERVAPGEWQLVRTSEPRPVWQAFPSSGNSLAGIPSSGPQAENPLGREHRTRLERDGISRLALRSRAEQSLRTYYLSRAEEAQTLAKATSEPRLRLVHLELASRYIFLADNDCDETDRRTAAQ